MKQSLEVFRDSFHSFNIFWVQKCKILCFVEKIFLDAFFYQIEVQVSTNWFM